MLVMVVFDSKVVVTLHVGIWVDLLLGLLLFLLALQIGSQANGLLVHKTRANAGLHTSVRINAMSCGALAHRTRKVRASGRSWIVKVQAGCMRVRWVEHVLLRTGNAVAAIRLMLRCLRRQCWRNTVNCLRLVI